MNANSRENLTYIKERNCDKCCHNEVCQYKGAFESVVSRVLKEIQADQCLIDMNFRCKFHMYTGGTTYKFDNHLVKGGAE